ncbi:secreted protein [Candidatus Omnitrophus magneticus]|uniref:Secreted protein n=1 Tax=Candidatus Omnitrophus magneticus TaxID=1609969 RepID=A0A0F0CQG6_9BACT|nr:secreted protein [Candidatus Omnitrophus magneticus]
MSKFLKKYFVKILSIFLSVCIYLTEVSIAEPLSRQYSTALQASTLITDNSDKAMFLVVTKYLWEAINNLEDKPENLNVGQIKNQISDLLYEIRNLKTIPENVKNIYENIHICQGPYSVSIIFDNFLLRFFNHNIREAEVLEKHLGSSYTKLSETEKGRYLSMQVFKENKSFQPKIPLTVTVKNEDKPAQSALQKNIEQKTEKQSAPKKLSILHVIRMSIIEWMKRVFSINYSVRDIEKNLKKYGWEIPKESRKDVIGLWEKIYGLYPSVLHGTAQHALRGALLGITIYSSLYKSKEKNFDELNNFITRALTHFIIASLAHDLGKGYGEIRVLTLKEGIFTQEEREMMKQHVEKSLEILQNSKIEIDEEVRQAILTHHPFYKGDMPKNTIDQILYIVDQIDARQDISRSYRKVDLINWNPNKIQEAFEEAINKKWISSEIYNVVTNLVKFKDPEYMKIVTSTYYIWDRQILFYILKDEKMAKEILRRINIKENLKLLKNYIGKHYDSFLLFIKKFLLLKYSTTDIERQLEKYGFKIPSDKRSEVINKWQRILNLYNPRVIMTKQHSIRGAMLAVLVYSRAQFKHKKSFEQINNIITAYLAHDLGKGDDELINLTLKKGIFSTEERKNMESHVGKSLEILHKAGITLNNTCFDAINSHHPCYGNKIPSTLEGQLIYLVDQIDARHNVSRPYRNRSLRAWDYEKILNVMTSDIYKGWIKKNLYNAVEGLITEKNTEYFSIITATYYPWQRFILKFILQYKNFSKWPAFLKIIFNWSEKLQKIPIMTKLLTSNDSESFKSDILKNLKVMKIQEISLWQIDNIVKVSKEKNSIEGKTWDTLFFNMINEGQDMNIAFWEDEHKDITAYMAFIFDGENAYIKFLAIPLSQKSPAHYNELTRDVFSYLRRFKTKNVNFVVAFGDSEMQELVEEIIKAKSLYKKYNKTFESEKWIYKFQLKKEYGRGNISVESRINQGEKDGPLVILPASNEIDPQIQEKWTGEKIKNNFSEIAPKLIEMMMAISKTKTNQDLQERFQLFIDEDIAGGVSEVLTKQIKKYLSALTAIKHNNNEISMFLKNLEITKGKLERVNQNNGSIPLSNIIVIADSNNIDKIQNTDKFGLFAGIDTSEYKNGNYYFPLPEIILFATAKYLSRDEKLLYEYYNNIPYSMSIEKMSSDELTNLFKNKTARFVIKLIPPARPFDTAIFSDIIAHVKDVLSKA